MKRRLTPFERSLVHELADVANVLVRSLNTPPEGDGPEFFDLSGVQVRGIIETAVRVAAARKRLDHLRRLRRAGRADEIPLDAVDLHLEDIDLDSPFDVDELRL
jgi:hypothetical protein